MLTGFGRVGLGAVTGACGILGQADSVTALGYFP